MKRNTLFARLFQRKLTVLAVPVWVIFIVLLYVKTRPPDQTGSAANVLEVGRKESPMTPIWLPLVLTLISQTSDLSAFEAATVKPALAARDSNFTTPQARYVGCHGSDSVPETGVPPGITIPLGRCIAKNVTLKSFIGYAYGVPDSQVDQVISGGPQWLNEPYDIEAKAEKPVALRELKLMVQGLLRERFKMAFHRETREISVFDLVEVKGGAKVELAPRDKSAFHRRNSDPVMISSAGVAAGCTHSRSVWRILRRN